jgi:L-fuconolactonase
MTPALDRLRRPFDHADVVAEQAEVGVGATVLVQAADNLEDTANMLRVARAHPQVAGVVAWVPLDDPAAAAQLLDGWQRAAEPIVGARHLVHRGADPDWLLRPEVQDGLAVLAERGLTFDVCAETPPLLRHVLTLAECLPSLSLVIDHLGKPPIRVHGWQPWADLLAAAAEAPNVTAKVSGLNTAADPARWSSTDFQPYIDHALEGVGTPPAPVRRRLAVRPPGRRLLHPDLGRHPWVPERAGHGGALGRARRHRQARLRPTRR